MIAVWISRVSPSYDALPQVWLLCLWFSPVGCSVDDIYQAKIIIPNVYSRQRSTGALHNKQESEFGQYHRLFVWLLTVVAWARWRTYLGRGGYSRGCSREERRIMIHCNATGGSSLWIAVTSSPALIREPCEMSMQLVENSKADSSLQAHMVSSMQVGRPACMSQHNLYRRCSTAPLSQSRWAFSLSNETRLSLIHRTIKLGRRERRTQVTKFFSNRQHSEITRSF